MNTRRITASTIIDSSMENVWSILTDYNNLATHVPNLVKSTLVPAPPGTTRLFQEGAQKIIGFDFRASLIMDMSEERDLQQVEENINTTPWKVNFKLIESRMFDSFDGSWILRYHSRVSEVNPVTKEVTYKYKTKLTYSVFVRPRGPVPVMALEWRIREDIPINLFAVKVASEKRNLIVSSAQKTTSNQQFVSPSSSNNTQRSSTTPILKKPVLSQGFQVALGDNWNSDETLQSYIEEEPENRIEDEESSSYPKKLRVYEVKSASSSGLMTAVNTFFGFNQSSSSSVSMS